MEPASRPGPPDPELDRHPAASPILLDPYFEEYQRLLSNPFLALAALVPWYAAARHALLAKQGTAILLLLAGLLAITLLLQYHCLDCGATGCLFAWKRHACDRSIARQLARTRRRFRGPNPAVQTVLWGIVVVIVAFLTTIFTLGRS